MIVPRPLTDETEHAADFTIKIAQRSPGVSSVEVFLLTNNKSQFRLQIRDKAKSKDLQESEDPVQV